MKKHFKKIIFGIAGLTLSGASLGADITTYDGSIIQKQNIVVANEVVKVEQKGNIVETVMPWKGEQGLTINYDMGEPDLTERLKDFRKDQVIVEKIDFAGSEGFKVDILLTEKPTTNIFCYTLQGHENYDFFYQPPLTQEEILRGSYRSPEIVGSYAVYHKILKNHKLGDTNYETGKVMHIPFPYVWEVGKENEKIRAEDLTYSNGQLCVLTPQDFLDKADYSNGVRIDPTFGYTSAGATQDQFHADELTGFPATAPENGNVTKFSIYTDIDGAGLGGGGLKPVLVEDTGLTIVTNGIGDALVFDGSEIASWYDLTYTITPSIINGQAYIIANVSSDDFGGPFYDTGGSSQFVSDTTNNYTSPQNPGSVNRYNLKYSIYATYTASSGGGENTSGAIKIINNGVQLINNGTVIVN